jgi:hypothetical protein
MINFSFIQGRLVGEMAQHREDFHWLGVQDVAEFDSDCWEKRKEIEIERQRFKKKGQGPFFSKEGHNLLVAPCGILQL